MGIYIETRRSSDGTRCESPSKPGRASDLLEYIQAVREGVPVETKAEDNLVDGIMRSEGEIRLIIAVYWETRLREESGGGSLFAPI